MSITLANSFERSGISLHNGTPASVRVLPAATDRGRAFVRVDLPDKPIIPARWQAVTQTQLSTQLGQGTAGVRTVEHLLAALAGMGIDCATIEVEGDELPILDGSAREWAEAIAQAGTAEAAGSIANPPRTLMEPIWVRHEDAFVAALPAPKLRFTYGIDFDTPAIGNQWYSWSPQQEPFATAIAPARTFTLAAYIEPLRAAGLIRGGNLDNALVCDANGWLNPPLRFANEPARHKILDLVGDISLLGTFPQAHFLAYKASHQMHVRLVQLLAQSLG